MNADSQADVLTGHLGDVAIKIKKRYARLIILGFLRHGQEGLNKTKREEDRQ